MNFKENSFPHTQNMDGSLVGGLGGGAGVAAEGRASEKRGIAGMNIAGLISPPSVFFSGR